MERKGPGQRIMVLSIVMSKAWRPLLVIAVLIASLVIVLRFTSGRPDTQPSAPLDDVPECGVPGIDDGTLYGQVTATGLPWAKEWPEQLAMLQAQHGAAQLVTAFRTTLPEPLFDEEANVALAARYLAGRVLLPGERVSLNLVIGPFTRERGYLDGPMYSGGRVVPSLGGGVCKIATTLYNAATYAGLTIVERHPHSMQVPYVPPGRDAAVAWGYKDLKFSNPYDRPVIIWAEMQGLTLFIAVYGDHTPPAVEWHHEELGREPRPIIRQMSSKLDPGEEDVVIGGFDGVTVRTWLTLKDPDGVVHRRDLGVDYYRPMPQVVQYGP